MTPTVFFTDRHSPLQPQLLPPYSRMHQCHSNRSVIVNRPLLPQYIDHCDALITQDTDHLLLVKTADCLPILIYKPPMIIAAIHAGKKGTDQLITQKTIQKIQKLSADDTGKWSIWLGPHICSQCYPTSLEQENITQINNCLDPAKVILIKSNNCTVCNNDRYFSHRKNRHYAGRFFSGIYL
jgi:copper oxidase (laccase) domain-containing protein